MHDPMRAGGVGPFVVEPQPPRHAQDVGVHGQGGPPQRERQHQQQKEATGHDDSRGFVPRAWGDALGFFVPPGGRRFQGLPPPAAQIASSMLGGPNRP